MTWSLALAVVLATTAARGRDLKDLIESPTRATMQDIGEALPTLQFDAGIPVTQGLDPRNNHPTNYHFASWLRSMLTHGPKLIAAMEKTFPGATWAFVGRDTQALGDLVEAFYLSLGQSERVVRLGVSKGSFQRYDDNTLLQFLESHRFSLKDVERGHPFIFVDTVSSGFGRQARLMLDTIYRHAKSLGIAPETLVRRVNIFGLVVSTFGGQPNPFQHAEQFFAEEERLLSEGQIQHYGNEHRIITFDNPGDTFNEAGYAHYTSSWHGPFGAFYRTEDGRTVALPAGPLPREMRESILWLQRELWNGTHQPQFLSAVQAQARALGYEFPLVRPRLETLPEPKPVEIPEEIRAILEHAALMERDLKAARRSGNGNDLLALIAALPKKVPAGEGALSENGQHIAEWMAAHRPRFNGLEWSVLMMRAARTGRNGLRLRSQDLQMVVKAALQFRPTTSLITEALDFADEANAFHDMLDDDSWIAGDPGYDNYERVRKVWKHARSCPGLLEQAAQTPGRRG